LENPVNSPVNRQAKNLPKELEKKVKEIEKGNPSYDEAKVWATAWSVYCKHINPGSPHCKKKNKGDYLKSKKAAKNPYASLVTKAKKMIKDESNKSPFKNDPKPLATGFVYSLFKEGVDPVMAQGLWKLFEGRGPSLDATAFRMKARQFASHFGGDEAPTRAAQFAVALLKSTRQPRLAKWAEALFIKRYGPLDQVSAPSKPKTPAKVFLETITPEIQVLAQKVFKQLGPKASLTFAERVAEDINWRVNFGGVEPLPEKGPSPSEISKKLEWSIAPDGAAFIYWLLNLAGFKSVARTVMKQALSEFPDIYEDFGTSKLASRVASAWLRKALRDQA
jgi:hypothetical protein